MRSAEAASPKVVQLPRRGARRHQLEFLPAALEIVETPAPPRSAAPSGRC
jgi:hypothetical protein